MRLADSLRCCPEPRPRHFNPRSRPFKPRAPRSKRQPRGFLLGDCCFLQQHHDAFCSVIGAWRPAPGALCSTGEGSSSALGTFCSRISSSDLGGWRSELDGRSFLLGEWSSELDGWGSLLDGCRPEPHVPRFLPRNVLARGELEHRRYRSEGRVAFPGDGRRSVRGWF